MNCVAVTIAKCTNLFPALQIKKMNKEKKNLIFLGSKIGMGKALLTNFYDEREKKIMSALLKKQTFLKRSLPHREKYV